MKVVGYEMAMQPTQCSICSYAVNPACRRPHNFCDPNNIFISSRLQCSMIIQNAFFPLTPTILKLGEKTAGPDIAPGHSIILFWMAEESSPWRLDVMIVSHSLVRPLALSGSHMVALFNRNHHRFLIEPGRRFTVISIQAGLRDGGY